MKIAFKGPIVLVKDIEASRKFYEEVLLQKVILNHGENIMFESGFSLQEKNSMTTLFHYPNDKLLRETSIHIALFFEVDDFSAFMKRLKKYTAIKYIHEEMEYAWDQRGIAFYDLDGHPVDVGESMHAILKRLHKEGLSVEEIAKKTMHPIAYIKEQLDGEE